MVPVSFSASRTSRLSTEDWLSWEGGAGPSGPFFLPEATLWPAGPEHSRMGAHDAMRVKRSERVLSFPAVHGGHTAWGPSLRLPRWVLGLAAAGLMAGPYSFLGRCVLAPCL